MTDTYDLVYHEMVSFLRSYHDFYLILLISTPVRVNRTWSPATAHVLVSSHTAIATQKLMLKRLDILDKRLYL